MDRIGPASERRDRGFEVDIRTGRTARHEIARDVDLERIKG